MALDTYSDLLGYLTQATGNNNNNWGDKANASIFEVFENSIAGLSTHTDTGGAVDLTTITPPAGISTAVHMVQNFTGALVSSITVTVPAISKLWLFRNNTTNNFYLYVKTAAGTAVQVPQGTSKLLYCDGTNVKRFDAEEVGDLVYSAKATVDSGTLQCDGSSKLRTEFPDLFTKIGTTWGAVDGTHFTLPDFVTNNRFLRAAGGSLAVATTQSNQNKSHTHTGSGTSSTESADHTHTQQGSFASGTESAQHTHSGRDGDSGSATNGTVGAGSFPLTYSSTAASGVESATHTHTTTISGATTGKSATHTHTYSFTTSTGSADGTEARPENAAVLICIKY